MTTHGLNDRDDLTAAVHSLIVEVKQLNQKLASYAPRAEVQRDSRQRAWKFFGFAVAVIILAQILSMSTISYCFLDADANRRPACGIMPGYNEALDQGQIRLQRFELLVTTLEKNRLEIDKLNREIALLKQEEGGQ